MILKLIVASSLTLAADLPPLSLKDLPSAPVSAATRPRDALKERRPQGAPLPGFVQLPDARPYLRVQGYPGRLVTTPKELAEWGLTSGDLVDVPLATAIVRKRMEGEGLRSPSDDE